MNTEAEKQRILNPKRHADPSDIVEADYEGPYEQQCEQIADIMVELLEFAQAYRGKKGVVPNIYFITDRLIRRSDEFEASVIDAATQRMRERGELD